MFLSPSSRAQRRIIPARRTVLQANVTYYVDNTKGSDETGNGTSGRPWKTLVHAYNYTRDNLDLGGIYGVTVQLVGNLTLTSSQLFLGRLTGNLHDEQFVIQGTVGNMAAQSVSSSTNSVALFNLNYDATLTIKWLTMSHTGNPGFCVLVASGSATVNNVTFSGATNGNYLDANGNASTIYADTITISGNATDFVVSEEQAQIFCSGTWTYTGTPVASGTGFQADVGGMIDGQSYVDSGSWTGTSFNISQLGVGFGDGTNNLRYFGGSVDGVVSTGGCFDSTETCSRAWTAFSSTVTADGGTFTTVSGGGRYLLNGKSMFIQVTIVITTVGTATGLVHFTLPSGVTTGNAFENMVGREMSVNGKSLNAYANASGASEMLIQNYDGSSPIVASATLVVQGVIEVA
jgi:hypothetical protein